MRPDLQAQQADQKAHADVEQGLQQFVGTALLGQQLLQLLGVVLARLLEVVVQEARQLRQQLGVMRRLGFELFPQFLGDSPNAALQLTFLCLIFVVVSAVWLTSIVFAASAMRKVMTTTGFTIAMEFVVAGVFAVLAITLLVSGLSVS